MLALMKGSDSVEPKATVPESAHRSAIASLAIDPDEAQIRTVLGPIFILKARLTPKELDGRRLVADMWLYPDGSRLLELSTKCLPADAFHFAAEVCAFLSEHGVDISGEQRTKTKKALEYFTGGQVG